MKNLQESLLDDEKILLNTTGEAAKIAFLKQSILKAAQPFPRNWKQERIDWLKSIIDNLEGDDKTINGYPIKIIGGIFKLNDSTTENKILKYLKDKGYKILFTQSDYDSIPEYVNLDKKNEYKYFEYGCYVTGVQGTDSIDTISPPKKVRFAFIDNFSQVCVPYITLL